MQKDVIYIDTEDNITDIIGKVKESEGKIIALVPPKRVGAIQSAVNLKLVNRAAGQAKKHLVIVTNNQALSALAASAGIPIAKNLQSKPEMPEASVAESEDDDIIDGNDLPVGDHVKVAESSYTDNEGGGNGRGSEATGAVGAAAGQRAARVRTKIPNFDTFRKKLFLSVMAVVLLIGFSVWAIVFAPSASIIIKAKTSDAALNTKVSVGVAMSTDLQAGTIKAELKSSAKDVSVSFTATGKKDVGEKATGTIKFTPINPAVYLNGATIPAGTRISSASGSVYTTDAVVEFDSDAPASSLAAGKTVGVTATASGSTYNDASGSAIGPSGFTTSFVTPTSGGTDKTVAVVQQSDIDTVSGDVEKSSDADQAKKDLKSQFGENYIVIDETFKADAAAVKPVPAVGQEAADGKGALAGKITYTIVAVPRAEAEKYLNAYFAQQVDGQGDQKVYDNGLKDLVFTNAVSDKDKYIITATTNGKVGPKIEESRVKDFAKGKKSGEIKVYAEATNGIESADVTFSPFWVTSAPNDVNKIKVQFNLND